MNGLSMNGLSMNGLSMNRGKRLPWTLAVLLAASSASAQDASANALLSQAEEALVNIEFEQVAELAQQAFETGGLTPSRLARAYELLGQANAALGREAASRGAYMRQIALQPDADVNTNLAPRLRSPFMEARGYWATLSQGLGVEARLVRSRHSLRILLTDPLSMAFEMRVLTRVGRATGELHETVAPARPSSLIEIEGLEGDQRVEYAVIVLDQYGNQVLELGSEDEPEVIEALHVDEPPSQAAQGGWPPQAGSDEPAMADSDSGGYGWVWAVVGVILVAGAVSTGLYFGLRDDSYTLRSGVSFR